MVAVLDCSILGCMVAVLEVVLVVTVLDCMVTVICLSFHT